MADVKWTKEQQDAIYDKGSNILVAAAAGSGKTAVLVERIINKVINENIDIDRLLVVTFTNAAASEMRERILEAIYKKMEELPDNKNLQRQLILINKASICTIDSFCLDIIRNNFYEIDVSANFRVADTTEVELLKQEVIDDIFENKYVQNDKDFLKLINTYTSYIDDGPLKELILKIYGYIQSNPFPEVWLNEQVEMFNANCTDNFAETLWGKVLQDNLKDELQDFVVRLKRVEKNLHKDEDLMKYSIVIGQDIVNLEYFIENIDSWDKSHEIANSTIFDKWPTDRKIQSDIKDKAKEVRDSIKKKYNKIIENVKNYSSIEAYENIRSMYDILKAIQILIHEFSEKFAAKKREKNIVDFNDIEHFALKILVKRNEDGSIESTDVAKKYRAKFDEIAIDEYQDSNYVQEYILTSVSNGNNVFMVGDVKQSIYKFRQACPDLFLKKYNTYNLKDEGIKDGQKIQLFKNFRSRSNILDVTNIIFENIMSVKLGDIDYNTNEFLNLGADYKAPESESVTNFAGKTELRIIDLKDPEIDVYKSDDEEEDSGESQERIEDVVLEARYVANNIKKLLDSDYMVFDKKTKDYRHITYKDIVVLLRSTSTPAPIYESEIAKLNLPVFSDVSSEYLSSMEIQTIMSVLKIIDNPMQDIPLVTVLRSSIAGFSDNELVQIRLKNKKQAFYTSLREYEGDEKLESKIRIFINNLKRWQAQEKYMALDELIWQIYVDTGFYNYVTLMPNGALRQANLKMLFERAKQYESASFKGLFNFINFIDKLHTSSGDLSSAKLIGENENVIRIMSIHKSKGLEFPVVYLCGTGKQFNMKDLNGSILLHQELGIGPKYINKERYIEFDTLAKEAIKIQAKLESLSEEMRVLYVALTRAKEKLIITGISKDWDKAYKDKQELIETYKGVMSNTINDIVLKKYKTYLDWITLVYLKNVDTINDYIELYVDKKQDIVRELSSEKGDVENINIIDDLNEMSKNVKPEDVELLKSNMMWLYGYANAVSVPTKTSVTKVKEMANQDENIPSLDDAETQEEFELELAKPKFLNETQELTAAQKGTLMHLCFQKLDQRKEYSRADIVEFVQNMVRKNIITELEGKSININRLVEYTKSGLWQELKKAKYVYKEQPFYINIKSDDIYKDGSDENILVQGIIDLYYINENDEIILVDYKTDWVEQGHEQELSEKYKKQLEIYSDALEKSLDRKVSKKYLYSVYLNKMIEC